MTVDLTKLVYHSGYPAFKNNNIFTGTLTIPSASTAPGTNVRTFTVDLGLTPDMVDITFTGPANAGVFDPRPSGGWFKQGYVWVTTDNAGGGSPSAWQISGSITGTILTITATYVQQFSTVEVLSAMFVSFFGFLA